MNRIELSGESVIDALSSIKIDVQTLSTINPNKKYTLIELP